MERKPLLISLMIGIILFIILQFISNLEFVKESSRTFEGGGLILNIIFATCMAIACYGVLLCVEDYLTHCSNTEKGMEFVRKAGLRYFLPIIMAYLLSVTVCGIFGINTIGEAIIITMIYFVLTFPKFVQKHLPEE